MESIITTFHLDWKLLIAQAINFGVVALVLWWFGFKPLAKLLEGRAEKIEQGLNDAAAASDRLKQAEAKVKELMTKARAESQAALVTAAEGASRFRVEELAKAKEEVEKTITTGNVALLAEKEEIMKNIRNEAADLIIEATKNILKDTKLVEVNKALADKAIAQVK
jgi:F-type H+-transporting ATPase subunit b